MRRFHRLVSPNPKRTLQPQSGELLPEEHPVIAGYRVGQVIAQGPLGKVYWAEQEQTHQRVILRGFARPEDADVLAWEQAKTQFRDQLARHQRIADMPDAPATIQKVIGFGEENGLFWIATEYFEGVTLRSIMNKNGILPMTRIIEILHQVAQAVDWMGNQGLPHTDLTPHNILLVNAALGKPLPKLHIEVINFGLAHARSKFGSPYAAPEQMEGAAGDRRADVYAVGTILHEMLTGIPLFSGATPEEVTQKVLYTPPRILIQRPQTAYKIVTAMVARQPEWRYQTLGEAIDDLMNNREPRFSVPDPFANIQPPLPPEPPTIAAPVQLSSTAVPVYMPDSVTAPRAVPTPPPPVQRPAAPEVPLQNYRLDNQDLVILRWRQEQEKRKEEEARLEKREQRLRWVRRSAVVLLPCLIAVWAMAWRDSYRYATVERLSGSVTVREEGVNRSLRVGDRIRTDKQPLLQTAGSSSVALAMPDGRLFLPQNSSLGLLKLDYSGGTVRHLALYSGSLVGVLEPNRRVRRFDVRAGKISTRVQSTYFFLTRNRGTVMAGTRSGELQITGNGEKHPVAPNTAVAVSEQSPTAEPIPMETFAPLVTKSDKELKTVSATTVPLFANMEEQAVAPVVGLGEVLWKLPTQANDTRAITLSKVGMGAICTLLMTADSGEGLPSTLDLTTLRELGMEEKERKRILQLFEEERIISYQRLSGGGYEIYARAKDTDHTLLRGSNGEVEVITNDSGS